MKKTLFAATSLMYLSLSTSAKADSVKPSADSQNQSGIYVSISAGGSWPGSPNYNSSTTGNAFNGSGSSTAWSAGSQGVFGLSGGFSTEAAIGYRFSKTLRTDFSYVYNRYSVTSGTVGGITDAGNAFNGTYSAAGSINSNSLFGNIYYDLPTKGKFVPYVGAGLGWTNINVPGGEYGYTVESRGSTYYGNGVSNSSTFNALGYQAKVGLAYNLNAKNSIYAEAVYQGNTSGTTSNSQGLTNLEGINAVAVRGGFRYMFAK